MTDPITLLLGDCGTPTGMTWHGTTYAVTDTPTRLDADPIFVTHAPACQFGWRFQGRPDGGDNRVFDVLFDRRLGRWLLVKIYA